MAAMGAMPAPGVRMAKAVAAIPVHRAAARGGRSREKFKFEPPMNTDKHR
jgi:hypothetical protein